MAQLCKMPLGRAGSARGCLAAVGVYPAVMLNKDAIDHEWEGHGLATAAVARTALHETAWGGVCGVWVMAGIIGNIIAGGNHENVSGNDDRAKAQYTQGDQYHVHRVQRSRAWKTQSL